MTYLSNPKPIQPLVATNYEFNSQSYWKFMVLEQSPGTVYIMFLDSLKVYVLAWWSH